MFIVFEPPQCLQEDTLLQTEKKWPRRKPPDGVIINSALSEAVCRYRQTPSFQILIS